MTFVRICRGSFMMGSAANDPNAADDEKPAHRVSLSEYWVSKTETTIAQYSGQGLDTNPATNISWGNANAFCASHGWRLPTEAEWEYAARAGTQTLWSFGDDESGLLAYAWFGKNSDGELHAVGTKKSNSWGISDMHGNAWEWVADWSGSYQAGTQVNPVGPESGEERVVRGGAFLVPSWSLRSAYRIRIPPSNRIGDIGFRCAHGASPPGPLSHRPPAAREREGIASVPRAGFGLSRIPAGMGKASSDLNGRVRELRAEQTAAEEALWELLRGRRFLGLKFRRQFPVESYIVDFCCYERRLVVELDGEVHTEPAQIAHDQNRDQYLRTQGFKILRFATVLRQIAEATGHQKSTNLPASVPPSPGGREGDGRGGSGGEAPRAQRKPMYLNRFEG